MTHNIVWERMCLETQPAVDGNLGNGLVDQPMHDKSGGCICLEAQLGTNQPPICTDHGQEQHRRSRFVQS